MDAKALKAEAMAWLRFGRRMPIVCTEAGAWSADVLGLDDKHSIEIEVKISKSDLKAEFTTKQNKHYLYKATETDQEPASSHIPNQFYFLVPETLKDAALEIIEENAPLAGLAICQDRVWHNPGDHLVVVKRAKKLHSKAPDAHFRKCCMMRMSSELVAQYHLIAKLTKRPENEQFEETHRAVLELVAAQFNTPDSEVASDG